MHGAQCSVFVENSCDSVDKSMILWISQWIRCVLMVRGCERTLRA